MRAAWTIALKDLKERIRDRSAFLVGIVAPLGLALIFSFIFNPIQDFEFSATYGVVDNDRGAAPALFADQVLGSVEGVTAERVATVQEASDRVDTEGSPFPEEDTLDAAFVFPAGFTDSVQTGDPVSFEVIGNEASPTNAGIASAFADGYASELTSVRVSVATLENLLQRQVDRFAAGVEVLQTPNPISVVDISASTKQLDGTTFYAAGLAIFFVFFTVQFGILSLLEERHAGTLRRLLAAPIPRTSIIAGKAINAFIMGVVSLTVLVVATTLFLGADWGNPVGVGLLIVGGIVAAIGVMSFGGSFAKTPEQAGNTTAIIALILGFLGGTFFPVAESDSIVATLRFITPHAWFMQGLGDLAGGELSVVVVPLAALVLFGVVTGAIGLARIRRGLQP
jgi:ABC-2 type transport system permease protein